MLIVVRDPSGVKSVQSDATLTTEHPQSSYGQPVVVLPDGSAWGPGDLRDVNGYLTEDFGAAEARALARAAEAGFPTWLAQPAIRVCAPDPGLFVRASWQSRDMYTRIERDIPIDEGEHSDEELRGLVARDAVTPTLAWQTAPITWTPEAEAWVSEHDDEELAEADVDHVQVEPSASYTCRRGITIRPLPVGTLAELLAIDYETCDDDGRVVLAPEDSKPWPDLVCGDCKRGPVAHAEAGYVPGHRICPWCGSHWSLASDRTSGRWTLRRARFY